MDPEDFTPAMRHGVAPIMNANVKKTFWGAECCNKWSKEQKRMMGCLEEHEIKTDVNYIMNKVDPLHSARETMQTITATYGRGYNAMEEEEEDPGPQAERVNENELVPEEPNAYADGSLKQSKGACWQTGGAGVWMPDRKIEDLTEQEKKYTTQEEAYGGIMMWCAFNTLINSSTRCELGAAIISMLKGKALNVGIDNAAVVGIGTKIINHVKLKAEAKLRGEKGQLMLGGKTSKLHRETPFKNNWGNFKNGDLWKIFTNCIGQRGVEKTQITKDRRDNQTRHRERT